MQIKIPAVIKLMMPLLLFCSGACFAQRKVTEFYSEMGTKTDEASSNYFKVGVQRNGVYVDTVLVYDTKSRKLRSQQLCNDRGDLHGPLTHYGENGKIKSVVFYEDGLVSGEQRIFYDHGSPERTIIVPKNQPINPKDQEDVTQYIHYWDSTGVQVIKDGDGVCGCIVKDPVFFREQGKVSGGYKQGEWNGFNKQEALAYTEHYLDGVLQKGVAYRNDGTSVNYTEETQVASFQGGLNAMSRFLLDNLRYPKEAKRKRIEGVVYVSFIIGKEGKIEGAKVVGKSIPFLDDEAVRVVSYMPPWEPGLYKGNPVRSRFVLPVRFKGRS